MLQFEFLLPLVPWLIILLAWMIVFVLDATIKLDKYGIEVGPFILMARTQRFNNLLDRLGRWHPRAWRYIWSGFVGVCFIFAIFGLYLMCVNLVEFVKSFLQVPDSMPGPVVPILPGITLSFNLFLRLLIPITINIIFHELAHGISARADDIPVKSSGFLAVLILWGLFVEPDEEYLKEKTTRRARVRTFAAGSGANLSLALVGLVLFTLLIVPVPQGVLITGIEPGSAADGVLAPGMTITMMNDTIIATQEDLSTYMDGVHPGDLIIFTIDGAPVSLTVGSRPNNASHAYIGIFHRTRYPLAPPLNSLGPMFEYEVHMNLVWFIIIALGLGVMNLLPVPALDGDKLFKELIDVTISLERKSGRVLHWGLRIFALVVLVLNIVFTFLNPSLLLFLFG